MPQPVDLLALLAERPTLLELGLPQGVQTLGVGAQLSADPCFKIVIRHGVILSGPLVTRRLVWAPRVSRCGAGTA